MKTERPGRWSRGWRYGFWFVNRYFVGWPLAKLLLDYDVAGTEYIPLTGGCLLAANHFSYLDPPVIGIAAPRPASYMARAELFRNRAFAALIKAYGAFPIKRDVTSIAGVKATLRKLEEGEMVLLFPEGTRTYDGNFQPPMVGAGLIAYEATAPVVPAYVGGTWELYPRGAKFPRPGKVVIRFGEPLDLGALRRRPPSKELYREIATTIMDAIASLRPPKEKKR